MKNREAFATGFLCGLLFLCVLSVAFGLKAGYVWHTYAVRSGHAHYDPMTGEFQWNKPCGEQPR